VSLHTSLKTKTWVLITGASSGFGEEFARQYAQQGDALVLVARRLDRLEALAAPLRQEYRVEVVVEQVDLSDVPAIVRLQERLRERGIAIDVLINNAGHGLQGPFADAALDAALSMVQLDIDCPAKAQGSLCLQRKGGERAGLIVDLAIQQYEGGRSSYYEVLQAQQELYPTQRAQVQARVGELIATAQLYKALGGGWQGQGN
jgi:short-subunit dehydrogenase